MAGSNDLEKTTKDTSRLEVISENRKSDALVFTEEEIVQDAALKAKQDAELAKEKDAAEKKAKEVTGAGSHSISYLKIFELSDLTEILKIATAKH